MIIYQDQDQDQDQEPRKQGKEEKRHVVSGVSVQATTNTTFDDAPAKSQLLFLNTDSERLRNGALEENHFSLGGNLSW